MVEEDPTAGVTVFEAHIGGGPWGPWYSVTLVEGRLRYTMQDERPSPGQPRQIEELVTPTRAEWREFLEGMNDLDVWNWRPKYFVFVMDGTNWSLRLETHDRAVVSVGSNGYPGDDVADTEGPDYSRVFGRFLEETSRLVQGRRFR